MQKITNGWSLEIWTILQWLFFHTTARRKTVVTSFWTSFKMLLTYQVLRQSFQMNRSYRATRQPLRDWKLGQIIEIFTNRSRSRTNLRGWVLLHMPALGSNSRKCWFLCWTYRWCTRKANSNGDRGLRGELWPSSPLLIWVLLRPALL